MLTQEYAALGLCSKLHTCRTLSAISELGLQIVYKLILLSQTSNPCMGRLILMELSVSKWCRKQHREEIVKLQQQLKSTTASTKGGAAEAERSKKELEKLR